MRWRDLFDDLEAQVTRAERDAFEEEVRERSTAERAAVTLGAVLASSDGVTVRVTLTDGTIVAGNVTEATAQWLLVTDGPREWLVPASGIASIAGLPGGAPEPGLVSGRLTLGHALRALEADGREVVVAARGVGLRGLIGAVGADYVVVGGAVVPFGAILSVSPAP